MTERARIRRIQVTNLFGIFNHEIRLNLDERITILHGPNGFGKTIILQMLDGLFRKQWERLRSVPFDEFLVEFDDGGIIRVREESKSTNVKKRRGSKISRALLISFVDKVDAVPQSFSYSKPRELERDVPPYRIESRLPFLVRLKRDLWHDSSTDETLGQDEVIDKYAEELLSDSEIQVKEPDWMKAFRGQISLHLIHTQRLGVIGDRRPAVKKYSDELVRKIKSLLATYASRSQELDSSFLDRLFQQDKSTLLSIAVLRERLERIEAKRTQLMSLGFLDPERETHKPPPRFDKSKLDVLSVYVNDTEAKLDVFEEMAQKVQLLTDAINKRFKYKQMSVSRETGFVFKSVVNNAILPLASLSSGEQHELVLFYELLFKVEPNALVLLDEPEISLHLAWQQQFLGDLVEMVKLSSFDVLIATHSPGIIGKRWDLTVELKGPDLSDAAQ